VRQNAGIALQFPLLTPPAAPGAGSAGTTPPPTFDDLRKARDAKLDRLGRLLDDARAYAKAAQVRQTDWVLDALVPVVGGRLPLVVRAIREPDIRDAIAFAERSGIRLVLSSGPEVALLAPLLKEKKIDVILGPILALPLGEDASHAASYRAAAELARAGVRFAFATGDTTNVRLLPYQAAESVAWGLSRDHAIRALTLDAADILGVGDRLGSIEPGKIANLLIAKGDPLEIRTQLTHVIVNGRSVPLGNRHLELYERYSKRP
jgi:imidazolonepropionase-like amidohydrolase